ncbi:peroxide stress protein YaaA [Halosquirtibacter xylanolyticus]|uniref:peroxide stress protein YaaA n=1 Tax=Halosquirtibacter xylanolyticus TaxID=3374599 RepID=UPI00374A6A79|nr:peroxide stress protein YaaA [Prolixibacteraceae bacterium]
MKVLLSPAKKIDFDQSVPSFVKQQCPVFEKDANAIVHKLQGLSIEKLKLLMSISTDLATLNYERFQTWDEGDDRNKLHCALWAFRGEVYTNLDVSSLSNDAVCRAVDTIRILSGLYGYLHPSDLIHAYRLEMGTKFSFDQYKNLYAYWKLKNTNILNQELSSDKDGILINLASAEYAKSIDFKKVDAKVITPEFKDLKGDKYKVVAFWAKKARGLMARYIVENNICDEEGLTCFNAAGYYYNKEMSTLDRPIFVRDH